MKRGCRVFPASLAFTGQDTESKNEIFSFRVIGITHIVGVSHRKLFLFEPRSFPEEFGRGFYRV